MRLFYCYFIFNCYNKKYYFGRRDFMIKTTLPVLILKGAILFPNSEIRLEIDSDSDKELLSLAESCYDKNILIVNQMDPLEETPDVLELPNVGVLGLMKKYLTEKQIQRTYKFFYDDISTRTEDEGVLSAIFNKFKEVFPFVKEQNESLSFEKYAKQMILGESFNKVNMPKFSLGTINVFKDKEWKIGNILDEANEVAGSKENMKYIAKTIVDNIETGNDGKPAKVWISGGAVRDEILGKPCNDIDLLTNCDVNAVAQLFDKCEIARVGNSKLARIWVNGDLFELGCLNEGGTIEENLNGRDLTCNAVLKDIIENKYFDPIGGIKDIKAKIIRFTKAANEKISAGKDPSELLRAFRFMSQLGWDFAPETEKAIASYSKLNNGKIKVQMKSATGPSNWKKLINGKFKNKAFAKLKEFGFIDWAKSTFPEDFN